RLQVAATLRALPAAPHRVLAEECSEDVREAPEVGEHGLEAAALEARLAVAGVDPAPLRIGEDLVGLGDLAETDLRVRLGRDVRVQVAGQRPEGALDVRV